MNSRVAAWWLVLGACASDPASPFASRRDSRSLQCTRLSQVEAARLHPGVVPEAPARGANLSVTDALVCERAFLSEGERPPRDEAILSALGSTVEQIVQSAAALNDRPDAVWHVDAFYPDPKVAAKISVAARTRLVENGRRVSDRVPVLAAGDVVVVSHLPFSKAYPTACARYFAEGSLADPAIFLGLMIVDPRETALHAGLCVNGKWKWLQ